jgi:hypothetical protein
VSHRQVGNGYVASAVGSHDMYVSGLYFGSCGASHKARLPSPIAGVSVTNRVHGTTVHAALDTRRGIFVRRVTVGPVPPPTPVPPPPTPTPGELTAPSAASVP